MAREFLLPDPGEGIHEADILEIHVSSGDEVKDGDALFSVETDKAVVDIPSSFDGTIEEVRVGVGDVVEVGSVLLTYTGLGDEGDGEATPAEPPEDVEEEDEEPEAANDDETTGGSGDTDEGDTDEQDETTEPASKERPKQPPVPASPATRSLAKRLGVDLHELEGSGPDGRIEPQDVQVAAGEETGATASQEEPATARTEEAADVEWVELRGVRRASAAQMTKSWAEIPHVTHHDVADITELESMRKDHADEIETQGGRLSMTVFLMKAAAVALGEHPRFNAVFDAENERVGIKTRVNIGVAVDTDEGLVVPVIGDVDGKSIAEIATELPEVAGRMRDGNRSLDDMQGGTFTITNPGAIGGTSFNPIINHPEVAILGAAQASKAPVLSGGGALEERLRLPLVLAFDHRVNDGADAARFMNTIKRLLEDPGELMLRA